MKPLTLLATTMTTMIMLGTTIALASMLAWMDQTSAGARTGANRARNAVPEAADTVSEAASGAATRATTTTAGNSRRARAAAH